MQNAEDVILIWTGVLMLFVFIFVLCCIEWSSELDPLLKVGFKSDMTSLKEE